MLTLGYIKGSPELEAKFKEHRKLVFWWSNRLARIFGGKQADYLGTVMLKFAHAVQTHGNESSKKYAFSTIFGNQMIWFLKNTFLRHESELRAIQHSNHQGDSMTNKNYALHESMFHLYRVPDVDEDDIQSVLDEFDDSQKAWDWFTEGIDFRRKRVLEYFYRDGMTLEDIGIAIGVTKQRVLQLKASAIDHIRRKLVRLNKFLDCFAINPPELKVLPIKRAKPPIGKKNRAQQTC